MQVAENGVQERGGYTLSREDVEKNKALQAAEAARVAGAERAAYADSTARVFEVLLLNILGLSMMAGCGGWVYFGIGVGDYRSTRCLVFAFVCFAIMLWRLSLVPSVDVTKLEGYRPPQRRQKRKTT